MKSQAELLDDLRQKVFDLLDEMARKREELNDEFVHVSVCSQVQQATRDTQVGKCIGRSPCHRVASALDGHLEHAQGE